MVVAPADNWVRFCSWLHEYGRAAYEDTISIEVSMLSTEDLPWWALRPMGELWARAGYPLDYFPSFLEWWVDYLAEQNYTGHEFWQVPRMVKDLI
jgi:hypothetical protein